jgi:hypothetical protein
MKEIVNARKEGKIKNIAGEKRKGGLSELIGDVKLSFFTK